MGQAGRIIFAILGASIVGLIGLGFLYAGFSPGERIEATVVAAPSGDSDTFVEFSWRGQTRVKSLESDRDLAIGSTVDISEPTSSVAESVSEYREIHFGFVAGGAAMMTTAVGLVALPILFNPEEVGKTKILASAANLAPEPSRHWLFLHMTTRYNHVTTNHYSFVMVAGQEVVLGQIQDITSLTETTFAELASAHKLKPYVDNVRSRAIKSRYKKSFAEPFMLQSVQRVEIRNNGIAIMAQDGVHRQFQVQGNKARDKYQVAQSLVAELAPGVSPVVETEKKRIGKDNETFVFQREMVDRQV